jgi:hypothetical protein
MVVFCLGVFVIIWVVVSRLWAASLIFLVVVVAGWSWVIVGIECHAVVVFGGVIGLRFGGRLKK